MTSIIKVDQIQTAAGGVPTAADLGLNVSGAVLQVVGATHNRDSGRILETTSTSYVQGSGLSVTIAPKSASSNILVMFTSSMYQNGSDMLVTILRDGVNVASNYGLIYRYNEIGAWQNATANWIEPANTTSSRTYTVAGKSPYGQAIYLGGENSFISTLVAIEIAG